MAWEFDCKFNKCSCPVCPCPRKEVNLNLNRIMEEQLSEKAEEALELIDYLKENGSEDVGRKYKKAEQFIRENGDVSSIFLDNLRKVKANTKPER